MRKLCTLVSMLGVWELAMWLFIVSGSISSYAEVADALQGVPKRVDLVHRNGSFSAKHPAGMIKAAMEEMMMRESDRIEFINYKLNVDTMQQQLQQTTTKTPLYSGQTIGSGNYIITIGLGTPATTLSMVIDTGSNLAWTQCSPCGPCYMQIDPMFDPSASSSFQQVACGSPTCDQLGSASTGNCSGNNCEYQIKYLDGSNTTGDFALDALSINNDVVSMAYPFGCGHENQGLFNGMDGLIGFSRDALAFPAQTQATFGQVFAYCLPPLFSSSAGYIEFGSVATTGSMSTPLVGLSSPLYVVELESIQVMGSSNIIEPPTSKYFVVDSGTILTRLDSPLYNKVRDSFKMATSPSVNVGTPPPGLEALDTCYSLNDTSNENIDKVFPSITFMLMGGLAFTPPTHNLLVRVDNDGTVCLGLLPVNTSTGFSILGNYQQEGHQFTFDIASSTLSISSTGAC